jgi:hypothetical protein
MDEKLLLVCRESIELRLSIIDVIRDEDYDPLTDFDILLLDEYEGMLEEELIEEQTRLNECLKRLVAFIYEHNNK